MMENSARLAIRHATFWLLAGNSIGLWLALDLLFPSLNSVTAPVTYGRLVPLHLNFQLYGWCSMPLVALLLVLYPSDREFDPRAEGAVLAWSAALVIGGISWCLGSSSGKIFLEWRSAPRFALALSMAWLWYVLASRFYQAARNTLGCWLKGLFLAVLLPVPFVWLWASSPGVYPAVNPHTGGPTGTSLFGSSLSIVLLLIALPLVTGLPRCGKSPWRAGAWAVLLFDAAVFALADKANSSHRESTQIAILGLLLAWLPLVPKYYESFRVPREARRWAAACLGWFMMLVLTGWLSFLPGALDRMKFTNALVAHSHLAMAGFLSSFCFLLIELIAPGEIPHGRASFLLWNGAAAGYVAVIWMAGFIESSDPGFTILPNLTRTLLYGARAVVGAILLACSWHWWAGCGSRSAMGRIVAVPSQTNFQIAA